MCCEELPYKVDIIWQSRIKRADTPHPDEWTDWGAIAFVGYDEVVLGLEYAFPTWLIWKCDTGMSSSFSPITDGQVRFKLRFTPPESCKLVVSGVLTYTALDGFTVTGTWTSPDITWAGAGNPCLPPGLDFADSSTWIQMPDDWIEIPQPPANGQGRQVIWTLNRTP